MTPNMSHTCSKHDPTVPYICGKAAGPDGLLPEHLLAMMADCPEVVPALLGFFAMMFLILG